MSDDNGGSWTLVTHDTPSYAGPPVLRIGPDGVVIGGDGRAGLVISYDLLHFEPATPQEADFRWLGGLYGRLVNGVTEVSVDRLQWIALSPDSARQLLLDGGRSGNP